MFGTIGHARALNGHQEQLNSLLDEWKATIRPKVPGSFLMISGQQAEDPGTTVFVALAKDEKTYRDFADMPEQQAYFGRLVEHLEAEPTWEDVEMEVLVRE